MSEIKFPNLYCSTHDHIAPGYIVCKHVQNAGDVGHYEVATEKTMGVAVCTQCASKGDDKEYALANFICACADAIHEMGIGI